MCNLKTSDDISNIEFLNEDGQITITGIKNRIELSKICIPKYINGIPVTKIDIPSYLGDVIRCLIIPPTVTEIKSLPCYITVVISEERNSVFKTDRKSIYSSADNRLIICRHIALKSYSIMPGTSAIAERAFYGCNSLESIVIPNSVTDIGEGAFEQSGLKSISLPESITSIPENMCRRCWKLESAIIPDSVRYIGNSAFENCIRLVDISIPQSVIGIGEFAFSKTIIKTLFLPSNLKTVSKGLFMECYCLEHTNIPENASVIKEFAYSGCISLKNVFIPSKIECIEDDAFAMFTDINTARSIYSFDLFRYECEDIAQLQSFEVDSENKNFVSVDGILLSKDKQKLIAVPSAYPYKRVELPESVKIIGKGAFERNITLEEIILPEGTEVIEDLAFAGCAAERIIFPETLKSIGSFICAAAKNLDELLLPNSVTSIATYAFSQSMISHIRFPQNMKKIPEYVCEHCVRLDYIDWSENTELIGKSAFKFCSLLAVTLPANVKTVSSGAFALINKKEMILPKSVTKANTDSFKGIETLIVYDSLKGNYYNLGAKQIYVRSSKDDTIRYAVRPSAWKHIPSVAKTIFKKTGGIDHNSLDSNFGKISDFEEKFRTAVLRLKYPENLSQANREAYLSYLKRVSKRIIIFYIETLDKEGLFLMGEYNLITKSNFSEIFDRATDIGDTEIIAYLLNYKFTKLQ